MWKMKKCYFDIYFDFYVYNDYDLVVSNVFVVVLSGVKGLYMMINGLGE